ncbi:MAG: autotransporter-associated beta strand repeat-containing protein [Luteolibacter sp.]
MKKKALFTGCLLSVSLCGLLRAADVTWDVSPGTVGAGNGAVTGGAGTWDTTTGNWTTDGGLNNVAWVNANNDTAVFGDTAGTVTVTTATAGGIKFNTTGYTVSGGTLTLAGTPVIATGTLSGTVNSILAGSSGFSKTGTGTLTLGGVNTVTGAVSIGEGIVIANTTTGLGATGTTNVATVQSGASVQMGVAGTFAKTLVLNGGTLQNNVTGQTWSGGITLSGTSPSIVLNGGTSTTVALVVSGKITGSSALALTSTSSTARNIQFTAANDYTGGTSIGSGVRVNLTTASGAFGTGKVTIASGGQAYLSSTTAIANAFDIAGTAWSGDGTPGRGAMRLGTGTVVSGPITLTAAAAVTGGSGTFSGVISGAFALNFGGSAGGTFTVSGDNTYSGATTIGTGTTTLTGSNLSSGYTVSSGTTLNIGSGGTSGSILSSATVANAGTFRINRSDAVTLANSISGAGGFVQVGTGTTTLTGTTTWTGSTTISAGTLQIGDGTTTGRIGSGAVTNNGSLVLNRSDDFAMAGAISGTGALTQAGSGTVTLSGTNLYTGATSVNSGKLLVTGSLAGSAVAVASGATLGGSGTLAGTATIADGGKVSSNGTLTLGGLSFSGGGTISYGAVSTTAAGVNVGTGTLVTSGTAGSVGIDLSAASIGAAGTYHLIQHASGVLSGADFAAFTVTGTSISARQSGVLVNNDGFLDYVVTGETPVWTGADSSVWKTGATGASGNWVLPIGVTPTNFITGDVAVFDDTAANKTVTLSAEDVAPSSVTFNNSTGNDYSLGGTFAITGTTALTKSGTGMLTLSNANTYSGGTIVADGVLTVANGSALGSGTATLNGGTLALGGQTIANGFSAAGGSLAGSGTLSGTVNGALVYNSPGDTLVLTGTNGNNSTTITAGTIQVGTGGTAGTLGAGPIVNQGSLVLNRSDDTAFTSGYVMIGAGSLVKNGAGTHTLAALSTYSGGTTVNGGTLRLTTNAGLGSSNTTVGTGPLTINAGATVTTTIAFSIEGNNTNTNARVITINGGTLNEGAADYIHTIQFTGGTLNAPTADYLRVPANGITFNTYAAATTATINNRVDLTQGSLIAEVEDGAAAVDFSFTGAISQNTGAGTGNKTLTKNGAGLLSLSGANTFAGGVTVNAGTLLIANTTGSGTGTGPVAVATGATLTGTGTASGAVTVSGTLAPGSGLGTIKTGALTLDVGSTAALEINTSSLTSDAVQITGDVSLGGGTLSVADIAVTPATLADGSKFTLMTYTGTLTGTFAGLAEGSGVTIGGNSYIIRYNDSKAVTLTVGVPNAFTMWAGLRGLGGADALRNADPDHDGIPNVLEFIFGSEPNPANPNAASMAAMPETSMDASSFYFAFRRNAESESLFSPVVQYSTDLTNWTNAANGVDGIFSLETPDYYGSGINQVLTSIPLSKAVNGKLFIRLSVP